MRAIRSAVRYALALLLLGLAPAGLRAQDNVADEAAAQAVATPWLQLLDAGEYRASWDRAAPLFRESIGAEQWERAVLQVRQATGASTARSPLRTSYTTSLPNAPAGEYVIVEYSSAFENLPEAVESVVLMKQEDGDWEVVGSFVRPAAP